MQTVDRKFERGIVLALAGLVVVTPVAMGAVAPWARSAFAIAAATLMAVWLLGGVLRGELSVSRHCGWLAVALLGVVVALQLAPGTLLESVQAGTFELARETGGAERPVVLSVEPDATRAEALRCLALISIFFVAAHVLRTPKRISFVLGALVVSACIQLTYGAFEQLSGRNHLLWEPHRYPSSALTGTFLNKNHFSGLLEMIVPVVFGLLFAMHAKTRSRSLPFVTRIARAIDGPHFGARVCLTLIAVALTCGVVFSLSRAGMLSLVAGFATFSLLGLIVVGVRRALLGPVAIGFAALAVGAFFGLGRFASGMHEAATGQAAQWHDRLDMWKSGVAYIGDFPLLGTGLGTFGQVFPIYQSDRFGDRWTNFLHNDWLQVFCEVGAIGAAFVMIALIAFGSSVIRGIRRRRGSPACWLAIGATSGVVAMLVHSVFDYNLARITSNGIVFAVLLACAWRSVSHRECGQTDTEVWPRWRIPMRSAWIRAAAIATAILGPVFVVIGTSPTLVADIEFNRYLSARAGRTADYFFWPLSTPDNATATTAIERAVRLRPGHAPYHHFLGEDRRWQARRTVSEAALERAKAISGAVGDRTEAGIAELARSLEPAVVRDLGDDYEARLREACVHYRRAIGLAPTVARHHADLAEVLHELDRTSELAERTLRIALRLAPRRPERLMAMARIHASRALDDGTVPDVSRLLDHLCAAIKGDTAYAGAAFELLANVGADAASFERVTPRTIPGYGNLVLGLWKARDWPRVERCLRALDELATNDATTRLHVARRLCSVLAIRQRWTDLGPAIESFHARLRDSLAGDRAEARSLRRRGRSLDAIARIDACLARDPHDADLLMEAAEIATLPCLERREGLKPIDYLARLARERVKWTEENLDRVKRLLNLAHVDPGDEAGRDTVLATAEIALGRVRDARERLVSVGEHHTDRGWRHLRDFVLGRACQLLGDSAQATTAFGRVVERAPAHRGALERLVALGATEYATALASLTPRRRLDLRFGAATTLLGIDVDAAGADQVGLKLYWRVDEPWSIDVMPVVVALDDAGQSLGTLPVIDTAIVLPRRLRSARAGEVVVQSVTLSSSLPLRYLRIGIAPTEPTSGRSPWPTAWGEPHLVTSWPIAGAP